MEPMKDLRPIVRFSEIKAWFNSRKKSILKGIYKPQRQQIELKNLSNIVNVEISKNAEVQEKQNELSGEIQKLHKSIERQNKKIDEAIWLLKTQFEDLEEQTIDQLLEMKNLEKHQIAESNKRAKKMKKELAYSMLDQQSMIERYFDRVVQIEQKLEVIKNIQGSSILKRMFGSSR